MVKNSRQRRPLAKWILLGGIVFTIVFVAVIAWLLQGTDIAILNPEGVVGRNEKNLIVFTVLLSVIVVVPVYAIMALFAWKYREGNTKAKYTPDEDGNRWLEALWWGIPIAVIGVLGVVTVVSTHQLDPYKPLNSKVKPLTVQVVALQWRWLFIYPEQQVATINELKIPAGTPINFQITADAPMSAFWIPKLGTQTYAMTGMTSRLSLEADHEGTYRGTNSNINGKGYADMNFTVSAMSSRRDFDLWAQAITSNESHDHMAWTVYEDIAKPSSDSAVTYYHLHDQNLYNEVLAKYTNDSSMSANMSMTDHDDDHEGNH